MSNIIIYSDLQKTYNDHLDRIVERIEDYVDTYSSILDAIYKQQSLIVVVQNKHCMNYLSKMQERYNEYITIKINSPRERFEEAVGLKIPDYITEEEIVQSCLLEKMNEIIFNMGMSFEDNLLNHCLGSYFTNIRFPFPKIVDFLKALDLSLLNVNDNSVLLTKVYKRRMILWQENCKTESERNIINAYLNNPQDLLEKTAKYLIMKNYPMNLKEDIVGELANDFEKFRIKDEPYIPYGMDTLDIQRNIKIYCNQRVIADLNYEDIIREIECLSGLFDEELQYVYNILHKNKKVLNASVLHIVRKKFRNGTELDTMFQEKLNSIIPPPDVLNPENLSNCDDWMNWALSSYLPYKFWMESNDFFNKEVDKYASLYGDWIFNNYDSLVSSESRMLHKTMTNIGSCIQKDELSLIVVIDNFNYKHVPMCKEYFNTKGFNNTLDNSMITMVPTETSVSKTAFFSGQPFNTEDKSYETLSKEWESFINGAVEYLSDISKLDLIDRINAKLYILNYLSIDKILHESQNNSALSMSYKIQEELKAMIDKIVAFTKRFGVENKLKVYFVSDHGSTKISHKQENLIDSKYYKSKTDDCAYRAIALNDKKFDIYKDSIGNLCYVLDRNKYGIKRNYLITKGYNRFLETSLSFYVHGGITPEENIVPLLKFERIIVKLIYPVVLLRASEFRYSTTSSIQLTIKNHNEYTINNVELSIMNSNIRWQQGVHMVSKIEKETQMDICLDKVRLLKTQNEKDSLTIKARFSFLGKVYEQNYEFSIKVRSTQENKFNFDDL